MKTREEQLQKRANRCIHFTGFWGHDKCKAGVTYLTVKGTRENPQPGQMGATYPCFGDSPCITCEKQELLGMEGALREESEFKESMKRMMVARAAIVEHTKGQRGVRGQIKCPCCEGGTLGFSVAGYNGHIHARCTTEGCASWME